MLGRGIGLRLSMGAFAEQLVVGPDLAPADQISTTVTPLGDGEYRIERTGISEVYASAASAEALPGDFTLRIIPEQLQDGIIGVAADPLADNSYDTIDVAIEFSSSGTCVIYQSSVLPVASAGNYAPEDALYITRSAGLVRVMKGSTVLYGPLSLTAPLYLDSAIYGMGASYRVKCFQ